MDVLFEGQSTFDDRLQEGEKIIGGESGVVAGSLVNQGTKGA